MRWASWNSAAVKPSFVDGGAVLYGSVRAIHKKNVRIVGYGVIDGSREVRTNDTKLIAADGSGARDLRDEATLRAFLREANVLKGCVQLYSCEDCEIAGVIARDSATFAYILADCQRVNCEWLKTIGMWRYNSDGIDLFNSRYVRIANGFFRDFDDCIVLKGIKGWIGKTCATFPSPAARCGAIGAARWSWARKPARTNTAISSSRIAT